MPFAVGDTLGPYRILEHLGQGGTAAVYKAVHTSTERVVALKVLHPAFKAETNFLQRFEREARVVAGLDHPHIVPEYEYAETSGHFYLAMKFIEGETLKARLERGPIPHGETIRIVEAVGSALGYAHRQGVLHRDIKPSNILLGADGGIYLTDFGMARMAQAGESTLSTDILLGTPQYISPEQALGLKDLDARTDIYSLGVMLYEITVGRVPFSADTPFAVIYEHIHAPLPLPAAVNPEMPADVERVLLKALAKKREDRYADVLKLVQDFSAALRKWAEADAEGGGTPRIRTVWDSLGIFAFLKRPAVRAFQRRVLARISPRWTPDTLLVRNSAAPAPRSRGWLSLAGFGLGAVFFFMAAWIVGRLSAPASMSGNPPGWEQTLSAVGLATDALPVIPTGYLFVIEASGEAVYALPDSQNISLHAGSLVPVNAGGSLQTGDGRLKFGLTDGSVIYMDSLTNLALESVADTQSDPALTRLLLGRGRVLVKSAGQPGYSAQVASTSGQTAEAADSVMGVEYLKASERFDVDCLFGDCRISMDKGGQTLREGQHSWIEQGELGSLDPARYDRWMPLAGQDVLWYTPTQTPTSSATPTPTPTPTLTRRPGQPTEPGPGGSNTGNGTPTETLTPTGSTEVTAPGVSPVTGTPASPTPPSAFTNTPIPPTNTMVPPTNTPVPPTSTPVPPTSPAVPTSTSPPPTRTKKNHKPPEPTDTQPGVVNPDPSDMPAPSTG